MILWRRMQNNSKSFISHTSGLEDRLLDNPKDVFYGMVFLVNMEFKSVPCNIATVSPSYDKVK